MRVLGIDLGARRVGLALSDATGTLATPWQQRERPASTAATLSWLADTVAALSAADDGLAAVVVGWPRRLDGTPTDLTASAERLARALERRTGVPVVLQDERLTSHEAEQRLAARGERDWRRRKARLDAEAAAIILQDYLDHRHERRS